MLLGHPHALWLLAVAPALAAMEFRGVDSVRRAWLATLRLLCVTAGVLALAWPLAATHSALRVAVVAVDVGPGMPAGTIATAADRVAALRGAADVVRLVAYSNHAAVVDDATALTTPNTLADLRKRLAIPIGLDDPVSGGSALADALRLAAAQVPADAQGRIVLITGGLLTRGDAEGEALRLARRGITLTVEPAAVRTDGPPTAIVRGVTVPGTAGLGETVAADVMIEALTPQTATVDMAAGASPPMHVRVKLETGLNHATVDVPLTTAGVCPMRVAIDGAAATVAAAIDVKPAARVLVVEDETDAGCAAALAKLLAPAVAVESVSPERLAARPLDDVQAVVLADLPAERLSAATQARLAAAVAQGTGLLVTGAARGFGPGGYADAPLAALLPVRPLQQMESIDPSTTLVLIIDSSGSMGGMKIDLAKDIARTAIAHLHPQDKVGIVEFYGGKRWAAPIQSAANTGTLYRALNRLTAGGSTVLYPAVEEAAFALRDVESQSKHVLILSDGFVENVSFAPLVRRMADDGVTVSTVATMPEVGPNEMPDIARWGRGRYYVVPDRFALPDISLKAPKMSLLSPVVQSPTRLVAGVDALTRKADAPQWPTLDGYVRTSVKPTADLLLSTSSGDPVLARWRCGAGFVAAMPTQLGSAMTRQLQQTPQFASVLSGLFRQLNGGRHAFDVRPIARPAGVEVDVTGDDPDATTAPLRIRLHDGDTVVRDCVAQPVAPGHWNVLFDGVPAGAYRVTAAADTGHGPQGAAGVAVVPPRAISSLSTDTAMIARLEAFTDLAAARAAALPPTIETYTDLRPWLATAALLLLLGHVAVRRWPATFKGTPA